ncbi:hypothetical protein BGZ73_005488 [Actinomortierella ambigua]|nr:hypothetical protein BGZ73_005488 [Actinomortierella ambigua]
MANSNEQSPAVVAETMTPSDTTAKTAASDASTPPVSITTVPSTDAHTHVSSVAEPSPEWITTADKIEPTASTPAILLPPVDLNENAEGTTSKSNSTLSVVKAPGGKPAVGSSLVKGAVRAPASGAANAIKPTRTAVGGSRIVGATAKSSIPATTASARSTTATAAKPSLAKPRFGVASSSPTASSAKVGTKPTSTVTSSRTSTPATATARTARPSTASSTTSTLSATAAARKPTTPLSSSRLTSTTSTRQATSTLASSRSSASPSPATSRTPSRSSSVISLSTTRSSPSTLTNSTAARARSTMAPSARTPLATTTRVGGTTTSSTTTTTGATRTPASLASKSQSPSTLRKSPSSTLTSPSTGSTATTGGTSPTPIRKTMASASPGRPGTTTPARPMTDAAKVKLLSTQLSGLQEKHDETLRLLQEQEERLKKELEEFAQAQTTREQERKSISSATQDAIQEMEDLQTRFRSAQEEHERAIAQLREEHERAVTQLREEHAQSQSVAKEASDIAVKALTAERDNANALLKELEQKHIESAQGQTDMIDELQQELMTALSQHEASMSLHAREIERLQAEHMEQLEAMKAKLQSDQSSTLEDHAKALQEQAEALATKLSRAESEWQARLEEEKTKYEAALAELTKKQAEKESNQSQVEAQLEATIATKQALANELQAKESELQTMLETLKALETRLVNKDQALEDMEKQLAEERERHSSQMAEGHAELELVKGELEQVKEQLVQRNREMMALKAQVQELTEAAEQNATVASLLKHSPNKYKVKHVQIYGSSVPGSQHVRKHQQAISDALTLLEIEFEFVDVASDEEARSYMRRKSGGYTTELPQVFSGGEYRGTYDDFEWALETNQMLQFLGFDRVRGFRRKSVQSNSSHGSGSGITSNNNNKRVSRNSVSSMTFVSSQPNVGEPLSPAQSSLAGEDAEGSQDEHGDGSKARQQSGHNSSSHQGLGVGVTGKGPQFLSTPTPTRPLSPAPSIASSTTSSPVYVKKAGYVHAASQAWNGVLSHDVTRVQHDLGIVTADDDELDELFEQGAVTEADLEAMLASV